MNDTTYSPTEQRELDVVLPSEQEVDAVLRKYDKGSDFRVFHGNRERLLTFLLFSFAVFQLLTATVINLDAMLLRSLHIGIGLCLVYVYYPARAKWSRESLHPLDLILGLIAMGCCLYLFFNYRAIVLRAGLINVNDMIVGIVMVVLVLEAARRVVGWPMVAIALVFSAYAFAGRSVPGLLGHRGVSLNMFIQHQFYTTEGILGLPIGVSSTFIFLFLIFGAFLDKTGMGEFFIELTSSIAGHKPGGPAKVAVLSSACMGTLSGSSVANVVGTGSFTIPMMKKLGYSPEFSGAVEATASTGGQLMPPIMGSAAFMMAEFTGMPYIRIVACACIPALLYYIGVWYGVHFEALKLNLKGQPKEILPRTKEVLKRRGHLIIPFIVVIYLLTDGFSPAYAALGAIASTILCSYLKKDTRMAPRDLYEALAKGARSALSVVAACGCAGIIIGVVTQTGLGLKMGSILVSASGGNLLLTLVFTMITSLILGIGVPTTANYVITSTIAAPALLALGVPVLAAHMFVFYFGIVADITPPVCLAAVAASGVAKGEPMRTGVIATRLAVAAFLIPYIFVYSPQLLLIDAAPLYTIYTVGTAVVGMYCVAMALTGFFRARLNHVERVALLVGGVSLVTTPYLVNIVAAVVCGTVIWQHIVRARRTSGTLVQG